MEVSTLNTLDTITNLIMLLCLIVPIYGAILSLVIGDMPRITEWPEQCALYIDGLHPMVKIKVNGHLKIITIRNPINNKWIMTLTIGNKVKPETIYVRNVTRDGIRTTITKYGNPYRYAMGCLAILALVACNTTEPATNEDGTKWGVIVADHSKACIESTPVVPDTIIKGLEPWTLKVGNGTRNRCHYSVESDWVECKAKSPDTLYAIDRYCPATLKARAELGG